MKTNDIILRSGNISFDIFMKRIKGYKLLRHRYFAFTDAIGNYKPQLRSFYVDLVVTFSDDSKEGIKLFVAGKFFKDISEHTIDDILVEGFITDKIRIRLDSIESEYTDILPVIKKEVLQYMKDNPEGK